MMSNYVVEDSNLIKDWNYEKNNELNIFPNKTTIHSERKVWWNCSICGEVFQRSIANKNMAKYCIKCSRKISAQKRIATFVNQKGSFRDNYPELVKEWNYDENNKLNIYPDKITSQSSKKVYWNCPTCGKIYSASISHRANGTSCPNCSNEFKTSFPEQAIYYFLKREIKNVKNRFLIDNNEVDIYIPDYNIAIEYDGKYFHENEKILNKEQIKYNNLKKQNIKLVRIKESKKEKYLNKNADYFLYVDTKNNYKLLENTIDLLFEYIGIKHFGKIDINHNRARIYSNYIQTIKELSLEYKNPELIKEWDYKKNIIEPNMVSYGSGKKFWWICHKGHSYEALISTRLKGHSCPYCAGQKAIAGENDIETKFPEILKEWDYDKNTIKPKEIMPYSNKKVWWRCSKGHSYKTSPNSRLGSKQAGCPICSNKKILDGYNDFATNNPILLKEWDYEKNKKINLYPDKISSFSNFKAYWKCNNGHSWYAQINSRVSRDLGCPYCKNRLIQKGYNDFESNYPNLIEEWDWDKNNRKPDEYTLNSNCKVYWKCKKCGYEWKTSIYHRTQKKSNCPLCSAKEGSIKNIQTRIKKNGSFQDNNPQLIKEWDFGKNNNLGIYPNEITNGSHKKVWWICSKGHNYEAIVKSRTRINGTGCPYCAGNKKIIEKKFSAE